MDRKLSARLSRIRSSSGRTASSRPAEPARESFPPVPPPAEQPGTDRVLPGAQPIGPGWERLSSLAVRRTVMSALSFRLDAELPSRLPALFPSFPLGSEQYVDPDRILVFDLETTGLSGGAGTVAFLAAFGRFSGRGPARALSVTQYLLLDYPGEVDFIDSVVSEFSGDPLLVTYNGKSFDSQILRTRCVMNGFFPPDPPHLDLVYPSRRLWKRPVGSCSLGDIERNVLGLDRGEDLPGSEAPDAWFEFLRTGDSKRLSAIADHNIRDIEGTAAVLVRIEEVARDPLGSVRSGSPLDVEKLALCIRRAAASDAAHGPLARELLETAAASGHPRAAFSLARDLRRGTAPGCLSADGDRGRAANLLCSVADSGAAPTALRAAALRILAGDSVRLHGDRAAAVDLLDRALALADLAPSSRAALESRKARLSGTAGTNRV